MKHEMPSIELLRELLDYDPETGLLTWKPRSADKFKPAPHWNHLAKDIRHRSAEVYADIWNSNFAGRRAGSVNSKGYRKLCIFPHHLLEHRVIYAIYYGEWPKIIDHINGRFDDNRIANLRSVSTLENNKNARRRKSNTSGYVGVSLDRKNNKWKAYIAVSSKQVFLGYFSTLDEAINARRTAEVKFDYHPNHGRAA